MSEPAEHVSRTRRVVIIGGVAAGMSAATRLRRLDESAEIVVLERGGYVSFANCGLAYHLGGLIDDRDSLILQSPEKLSKRFRLDVRVHHEVIGIDLQARELDVVDRAGHAAYREPFDQLVIATGAHPKTLDIPGADRMLALRSIEDMDRIAVHLDSLPRGASIAVVGGGYIGLEMADNLLRRGFRVAVIHRGPHLLATLDAEMAAPVEAQLRRLGVDLVLGEEAAAVTQDGVVTDTGRVVAADLVIAAVGVTPEVAVAAAAGIRIGATGGIDVDGVNATSAPGVFAIGDVAEKTDIDGRHVLVEMAGPANRDGRYLADTLVGHPIAPPRAIGTAIVEIAGLTVASVGLTERAAHEAGRSFRVIHTHPTSHATYYPGAESMSLKLVVDDATGLILGAQAVGGAGVDKRIDVLATAMAAGLTAARLADLELAYAPQYGSAKDPINMLGYIARNMAEGQTPTVQWHELEGRVASGDLLIDVRTPAEFAAGSIPGARNVPLDDLRAQAAELAGHDIIAFCQVGQRGHTAASLLRHLGFHAVNLDGGYRTWSSGRTSRLRADLTLKGTP